MSARLNPNDKGSMYPRRGHYRRASHAMVCIRGADISVEFFWDGDFMAATQTDPACLPEADIRLIEIGGQDCTRLLEDTSTFDEIKQAVERQMDGRE